MSKKIGFGIFIAVAFTVILPMVAIIAVFQNFGVAEYVLPILLPSFFSMILIIFSVGVAVIVGSRITQRARYLAGDEPVNSREQQESDITAEGSATKQRRFFIIPVYCPHCGSTLDLQRAGWISSRTLTCPDCFHDIGVRMSG